MQSRNRTSSVVLSDSEDEDKEREGLWEENDIRWGRSITGDQGLNIASISCSFLAA